MTENKEENMPAKQEIAAHSHDSFYLVSHGRGDDWPRYESCLHCSFIRVPSLEAVEQERSEYRETLERISKNKSVEKVDDHHEWGNADDSYEHGKDVGEGYCGDIAREVLSKYPKADVSKQDKEPK